MKITILGSGGCVSTPRACCNCPVCTEARQKGFPYARTDSVGEKPDTPTEVASLPAIVEDIGKQAIRFGSVLGYYQGRGLIRTRGIRSLKINDILIELIPVDAQEQGRGLFDYRKHCCGRRPEGRICVEKR